MKTEILNTPSSGQSARSLDILPFVLSLATEADRDAIWNIFHEIVAAGDTYAFDPGISREEALAYWFGAARILQKTTDALSALTF